MKKYNKQLMGLMIIIIAIIYALSTLNYFGKIDLLKYIFTAIFIVLIISGILNRKVSRVIFSLAFIAILFKKELNIEEFTTWSILLIAFLLTIGIKLLTSRHTTRHTIKDISDKSKYSEYNNSYVRHKNSLVFGYKSQYIKDKKFVYMKVENVFSKFDLYLNECVMLEETAEINFDNVFGTVRLYLPKNWNVEIEDSSAFGSFDIPENRNITTNTLIIKTQSVFSKLYVRHID